MTNRQHVHVLATRQYLLLPRTSVLPSALKSSERLSQLLQQKPELVDQLQLAFNHGVQQLDALAADQQQQGSPPLWQQALLQVVAASAVHGRAARPCGLHYQVFPDEWGTTCGVDPPLWSQVVTDPLLPRSGLDAGRSVEEVQQLITARLLPTRRPPVGPPAADKAPWGRDILRAALIHRAPDFLSWSLEPERAQWWPSRRR